MIDRELIAFVIKAKKKTYASVSAKETILPDGGRKLIYEDDSYYYEDIYYGFLEFYGREVAFKKIPHPRKWIMQYAGIIPQKVRNIVDPREVYADLKTALRVIHPNRPFRGPRQLTCEKFEYISECTGEPDFFFGSEAMRNTDTEPLLVIYLGSFHGIIQEPV
ncbi:MAG: DUF5680 domain-containing protein [bacterium]|nr:DUF5680 domain-containing protein [bacterium]